MDKPRLAPAGPDDLEVLLPLVRAYHEFEGVSLSDGARRAAVARLLGNKELGAIWLISVGGAVVGYVALCFGYSIEFGGRDAFVDELFILEPHRGQGIGRAALAAVRDEAASLALGALHLEVDRENHRARSLYRSLGFESRERFHLMSRRFGSD
ncbi:MAG: GNAT family N-acetyltransferase [Gammaproteobacteria bacterium]|nr:GNAT family N-acetyltransferase [Gammaproteobacteria bacterium]